MLVVTDPRHRRSPRRPRTRPGQRPRRHPRRHPTPRTRRHTTGATGQPAETCPSTASATSRRLYGPTATSIREPAKPSPPASTNGHTPTASNSTPPCQPSPRRPPRSVSRSTYELLDGGALEFGEGCLMVPLSVPSSAWPRSTSRWPPCVTHPRTPPTTTSWPCASTSSGSPARVAHRTRSSRHRGQGSTGEHPTVEGRRGEALPSPTSPEGHRQTERGAEVTDVKHYAYRVLWSVEDGEYSPPSPSSHRCHGFTQTSPRRSRAWSSSSPMWSLTKMRTASRFRSRSPSVDSPGSSTFAFPSPSTANWPSPPPKNESA
jgi:hypothetical protein